MIRDVLIQHGMTGKEAAAYLAGLELGPSPASRIARTIKESRVNTYAICQNLIKKNFATAVKTNNVTNFDMIAPQQFLNAVESKFQDFTSIMPDLVALSSKSINKPKVKYYEGLIGLKRMFDDILVSTESINAFLGAKSMDMGFKDYMDNEFIPLRVAKGIPIRVIASNTPQDMFYAKTAKECLREFRLIQQPIFAFSGEIMLYGSNKVAIGMYEPNEMMGVVIESKHFYSSQQSLFELIRDLTSQKSTSHT